ncbi:MAG: hypothetical protein LPJ92_17590 [Rhodobacterales bacterium]|nr:hypothetical protein [Rhodobacterales bacterium]MDX5392159.1 hypothetical protein [Rhodobacterales bacterium]MDX5491850.1 hypothetical protein [Rhodobacterales bacterium]
MLAKSVKTALPSVRVAEGALTGAGVGCGLACGCGFDDCAMILSCDMSLAC